MKSNRSYFITGNGTDVGKSVCASIVVEALQADYWKPVQAGELDASDTMTVRKLVTSTRSKFHCESYRLSTPMSPHAAADIDGVKIDLKSMVPPETENILVIEGAGGLLVPLNENALVVDLIQFLNAPVILISRNYLGSINHTLLTVEALRTRGIEITGIIFNGVEAPTSESFILSHTQLPCLLKVKEEKVIDRGVISRYANELRKNFESLEFLRNESA